MVDKLLNKKTLIIFVLLNILLVSTACVRRNVVDKTKKDTKYCPVHNIKLEKKLFPKGSVRSRIITTTWVTPGKKPEVIIMKNKRPYKNPNEIPSGTEAANTKFSICSECNKRDEKSIEHLKKMMQLHSIY